MEDSSSSSSSSSNDTIIRPSTSSSDFQQKLEELDQFAEGVFDNSEDENKKLKLYETVSF